jgi:hypothetical protein
VLVTVSLAEPPPDEHEIVEREITGDLPGFPDTVGVGAFPFMSKGDLHITPAVLHHHIVHGTWIKFALLAGI